MRLEDLPIGELEQRVSERKRFIIRVRAFVQEMLEKYGTVVSREIHSAYTHLVRELRGWDGFVFQEESGKSMMGGEDIYVYYSDQYAHETIRLSVFFSPVSDGEFELRTFDSAENWQKALTDIMDNPTKTIADFEQTLEAETVRFSPKVFFSAEARRHEALVKEAVRLKL